jgi:hypothetical protein
MCTAVTIAGILLLLLLMMMTKLRPRDDANLTCTASRTANSLHPKLVSNLKSEDAFALQQQIAVGLALMSGCHNSSKGLQDVTTHWAKKLQN